MFSIYNIGGMTAIYISTIVFASILGIIMYGVNVKLAKNRIISFILTIGTLYLLKPYICARAQLVTFILFILTVYFIEQFLETKKIRYAIGLTIIPILIANLHIATFYFYFILYMPYIAEFMIYILSYCNVIISKTVIENIKKKIQKQGETEELLEKLKKAEEKYKRLKSKEDERIQKNYKIRICYNNNIKILIIIFVICLFTGFLTPLGKTPYTYLIKTMQGISTKNISEHLPIVLADNAKMLITFAIYIGVLMFTRVKVRLSDLFMLAGLALLTIMSRRQASMFCLIGVIILNRLIMEIFTVYNKKDVLKKLEDFSAKIWVIAIISAIVIGISIHQYSKQAKDQYINENDYPVQAANWIKENLDLSSLKLYNEYNYGSYLIYQGIPVFVDSRCDLYLPEFNENVYVFRDFLNINNMNLKNVESKIDEYGFTHFIVLSDTRFKIYLDDHPEEYRVIYPTEDIQDNNFTIYERINNK